MNSKDYEQRLNALPGYCEIGRVIQSIGLVFEAYLPGASLGSLCQISMTSDFNSKNCVEAEVVGFRDKRVLLMPLQDPIGINNESSVILVQKAAAVRVGSFLLGRVLDGLGAALDDQGVLNPRGEPFEDRSLYHVPTHPLQRKRIHRILDLGIRAINGLLSCGEGQRLGIMAGSGVGKSVLLGMMARHTHADVNVIALIGERGREVLEFIERDLGEEGLKKSVLVVSTSDKSPLLRMRGAYLATTIAEYFRDQGKSVLLMMDSITRFCMAQREIGLSLGEPPAAKGYTPSVFAAIPKLLERAGMAPERGSITGLYTVLVEGDDLEDPIADSVRAILDGHIVLSRKISQKNFFPAIDILQSTSRVMRDIVDSQQLQWANQLKNWMALYAEVEDLVHIGAYVQGNNLRTDEAVERMDRINAFLRQDVNEGVDLKQTLLELESVAFKNQFKKPEFK